MTSRPDLPYNGSMQAAARVGDNAAYAALADTYEREITTELLKGLRKGASYSYIEPLFYVEVNPHVGLGHALLPDYLRAALIEEHHSAERADQIIEAMKAGNRVDFTL